MKKTIRTILYAAVFAVLAVSCQKEINGVEPETNTKETIEISINGLMGEYTQVDGTKADLVNTVRVSWKGGETVYVYDGTHCLGSLAASLDENGDDRFALLSTDTDHTVSAPADGTTNLTLVYSPLLTEAPSVSNGAISISLASQSSGKAPFVAYATLDYTGTTITNAVVPFKFATSVIKVNCTGLKASTTITSATLSNVNTECKLTLSGTSAPTVAGEAIGTITRTGDEYFADTKVNTEGEAVFQIAVPVLDKASEARVLTVEQDSDKVKDKKFSQKDIAAATSVNTVCQLKGLPAGALKGKFSVSNDGGTTIKQVHFSQGNLYWDGCAFKFEANQYSGTSHANNHVSHFYWSKDASVAYAEGYDDESASGSDVFFTNETETTSKDGFTVNVGGTEQTGWRTLSTAEWTYLFNNHTKKLATVNGVNGYVIAPDGFEGTLADSYADDAALAAAGNLVFLPAAGVRDGSDVLLVGDYGLYWSSTAFVENCAYCVRFYSNSVYHDSNVYRDSGFSVRLITESN